MPSSNSEDFWLQWAEPLLSAIASADGLTTADLEELCRSLRTNTGHHRAKVYKESLIWAEMQGLIERVDGEWRMAS